MLRKTALQGIFYILILIIFPVMIFSMGFKENKTNGNNLFKEGDFQGASTEYSEGLAKKADYDLYYNRGVSYYKLGQFDKSYSDFEDAATYANSTGDQIKAVYNAGNSNFMMAETLKTENPGQALEFYGQAVRHFERVLELDIDNTDAAYNLELSRLRLDEIEQQQNEDKEEGDEQSEDQQDGDQQEGSSNDGEGQKGDQQEQNQQDSEQHNSDQQDADQQQPTEQGEQQQSESSESAYSEEEISPKDILNEEARRQEAIQTIITNGSGEIVDKDW